MHCKLITANVSDAFLKKHYVVHLSFCNISAQGRIQELLVGGADESPPQAKIFFYPYSVVRELQRFSEEKYWFCGREFHHEKLLKFHLAPLDVRNFLSNANYCLIELLIVLQTGFNGM